MSHKEVKSMSQIMIFNGPKLLLGMKKRGLGCGRWDGFGGKLEIGESMDTCAIRETKEECGLKMEKFEKFGHMTLNFIDKPVVFDIHIYKCTAYSGEIIESEEMRPQWFEQKDIPYSSMWPSDVLWYPYLLSNKKFKAEFLYEGYDTLINHSIIDWDSN